MHWLILALSHDECGNRVVDVLAKEEVEECRKRWGDRTAEESWEVDGFDSEDWERDDGGGGLWEDGVDWGEEELRCVLDRFLFDGLVD